MTDSPSSLITVVEYKSITGIDTQAAKVDEKQLEFFCAAATARIESECQRKFVEPISPVVETFSGNGALKYYVRQGRISANATPTLAYYSNGAWVDVAAPTYSFAVDNDAGCIYFTDGNIFFAGATKNNWRITYKYGWPRNLAPADLKHVCAQIVQRGMLFQGRNKEGIASESTGESAISFNPSLSDDDIRILRKYRFVSL